MRPPVASPEHAVKSKSSVASKGCLGSGLSSGLQVRAVNGTLHLPGADLDGWLDAFAAQGMEPVAPYHFHFTAANHFLRRP